MATPDHPATSRIRLELTAGHAWALAQFVKRIGFGEMRNNAVADDEAYAIRGAIGVLATALRAAGYAPR